MSFACDQSIAENFHDQGYVNIKLCLIPPSIMHSNGIHKLWLAIIYNLVAFCCKYNEIKTYWLLSNPVAAFGENDQEGCKFSYLLEHLGLSPWLFLIISGVSIHSSRPNLTKFVIFSFSYWYIENIHISFLKWPNLIHKPNRNTKA